MRLLYYLLQASWRQAALAIILGILGMAGTFRLLALIHNSLSSERALVEVSGWQFTGLCLVVVVSRAAFPVVLIRLSDHAVSQLRLGLAQRILATPLRRLEEIGLDRLMAALIEDVTTIMQVFHGIPNLCIQAAIVGCCLLYLCWLSVPLLLALSGLLLLGTLGYQRLHQRAQRHLKLARGQQDLLMNHLRALLEGIKELKMHARRRASFVTHALRDTNDSLSTHYLAGMSLYWTTSWGGQFLCILSFAVLLFVLPKWGVVEFNVLVGMGLSMLVLMSPLEGIARWLPYWGAAQVSLNNLDSLGLLTDTPMLEASSPPAPGMTAWERLELLGVTHTYRHERDGSMFTLGPIDLTLSPREIVFLVGTNGSGKTTLVKLLTGLYAAEAGGIRLDGRPVGDATVENYRQLFSVVFADYYLFSSLLGLELSDLDRRAGQYLTRLELDHKVRTTNGILSTVDLSKGQRKRLALLTAFLEDRAIYVFDEWASDQDPQFKEVFYTQLIPELKSRGKTVVVVSHDEQFFHVADRVIRLTCGKGHEEGKSSLHATSQAAGGFVVGGIRQE